MVTGKELVQLGLGREFQFFIELRERRLSRLGRLVDVNGFPAGLGENPDGIGGLVRAAFPQPRISHRRADLLLLGLPSRNRDR